MNLNLPARVRGILYVVLIVAGVVTGVGAVVAPDVAGEAAAEASGWVESILALLAVAAGVLARLNLSPGLTALERHADADAAALDPSPGVYAEGLSDEHRAALVELRALLADVGTADPAVAALDTVLHT